MVSRPLSEWVTTAGLSAGGTASEVNFGDERADARTLPEFASGWRRAAVPADSGDHVLALVRDGHDLRDGEDTVVIELDNRARPVRVSPAGAGIIARIEDDWPGAAVPEASLDQLAAEPATVGYLLLARLAAEGRPDPGLFRMLPWPLVDELAAELTAALGGGAAGPVIELGHWFTPAGSRFTAALEQFDAALRAGNPAVAREAATALCARLGEVDRARLPASTRAALTALVGALRRRDRLLELAAAGAARNLAGADANGGEPVRLPTRLAAAAASTAGIRRESRTAVRGAFELRLTVTAAGRAEISLTATLTLDQGARLDETYGVPLQQVTITSDAGAESYLIPLAYADGDLTGQIVIRLPEGSRVAADTHGPPIGGAEARYLNPAEVERSVRALPTRSARSLWQRLASLLPPAHPLGAVIERAMR